MHSIALCSCWVLSRGVPFPPSLKRDQELNQAHHELKHTRQCLMEKKDELKEKDRQLEQLRAVTAELQQTVSGRMQPQVYTLCEMQLCTYLFIRHAGVK